MNTPGFSADASLYRMTTSYRMMAFDISSSSQILPVSVSRFCGSGCAAASNDCTRQCSPYDTACRDTCTDQFFGCYGFCTTILNAFGLSSSFM